MSDLTPDHKPVCDICGEPATRDTFVDGRDGFRCDEHKLTLAELTGWRPDTQDTT